MPYASRADLEDRYAQDIAQRELVLPVLGVDNALADADAEIDGYVGVRYQVPLSPVPASILRIACVIARYRLLGDAATEVARRDYEDARGFLRDVAAGRSQLEGVSSVAATGGTVQMVSAGRLFARGSQS